MNGTYKQKITTHFVATAIIGALMFMFGSTVSNAETVYFNDANRGPSATLQIGPVTVSASPFGGVGDQSATVLGAGLGISAGIGPIYEVNRAFYMTNVPGQPPGGPSSVETISLSLASPDMVVNSITLVPSVSAWGPGGNVPIPTNFTFVIRSGLGVGPYAQDRWIDASSSSVTLYAAQNNLYPHTGLTLRAEPDDHFNDWSFREECQRVMLDNGLNEINVLVGVSILSLDYSVVPEPSAAMLLGMGLLGALYAKWRRAR
jgi:hypothetical protein